MKLNAVAIFQRVYHYLKYGDSTFPRAISIEVSKRCNRSCYYCANSSLQRPEQEYISPDLFSIVLTRIAEIRWFGPVTYHWLNEPTLHEHLPDLVSQTRQRVLGALPEVYTNGDFLDVALVRQLIESGVYRIIVTRHPPFRDEWDERIGRLKKAFPKIIFLRGKQGVIENANWLSNFSGLSTPKTYRPLRKCSVPSNSLQVSINGDVNVCCVCCPLKTMGNLQKESIMDIWHSERSSNIRSELRKGHPPLKQCRACFGL